MKIDENYAEKLCNAVAKTILETFENLSIEDINMYQLGYYKAIDDMRKKLLENGFIFTGYALNAFDEIAKELKRNHTLERK